MGGTARHREPSARSCLIDVMAGPVERLPFRCRVPAASEGELDAPRGDGPSCRLPTYCSVHASLA